MSQIDEILDDLGESFYPMHEYPDQPIYTDRNKEAIAIATKALRELLLSEAVDYIDIKAHIDNALVKTIPIEAINKLFGGEE